MWFAGFRGAMAFALAIKTSFRLKSGGIGNVILTLTVCYALMNILLHASFLEKLIKKLEIKTNNEIEEEIRAKI